MNTYALLSRNTNKMQFVIEFIIPKFIEIFYHIAVYKPEAANTV